MKNLTLAKLQKKSWYRLIKVLYTGTFLLIVVSSIGLSIAYSNIKTIDPENTQISCILGNEKTFSASELGLYLSSGDFEKDGKFNYTTYFERYYSTQYEIRDIFEACSTDHYADYSNVNIFIVQARTEINHDNSLTDSQKTDELSKKLDAINRNYGSDSAKYLDFKTQIFSINPIYTNNTLDAIGYLILALIAYFTIFESTRRIFYYIVLGTWRPTTTPREKQ